MRTFRELCQNKPSVAVRAMLDGLAAAEERDDFRIYMGSYGETSVRGNKQVCIGCAATCAVQRLTGVEFKPGDLPAGRIVAIRDTLDTFVVQAGLCQVDVADLERFERAIEAFRCSLPGPLLDYFQVSETHGLRNCQDWTMDTDDWQSTLPEVERYIEKLEAAGL